MEMPIKVSEQPQMKKLKVFGNDYTILKSYLKEQKKIRLSIPRLLPQPVGVVASLAIEKSKRVPIYFSDIQRLLLYSMLGHHAPYSNRPCLKLEKFNKLSQSLVFIVEGISVDEYQNYEDIFLNLKSKFEFRMEVVTPTGHGGSIVNDIAAVPLTGTQKVRLVKQFGSLEAAMKHGDIRQFFCKSFPIGSCYLPLDKSDKTLMNGDKFSRRKLLLSPLQLVEENYPVPLNEGFTKTSGRYVFTKETYSHVTDSSPLFAIDCEMCKTTSGESELTRVSVVNENYEVILDTFVKPKNDIVDYMTQYSGITSAMLENVDTNIKDVQKILRQILPSDAILVGQSLNFDLHALKMMHPYIIDTSIIYNRSGFRFCKSKLKTLAKEYLKENIQMNGPDGHDSCEDAMAALKLVKLKLSNGVCFGDVVIRHKVHVNSYHKLCKEYSREEIDDTFYSTIFLHLSKVDKKTAAVFGTNNILRQYAKIITPKEINKTSNANLDLITAKNNSEAVSKCTQYSMDKALNFCHIKITEEELCQDTIIDTLKSVDESVKQLWDHMALNGLMCVIFTGRKNSANGACFINVKNIDVAINCEKN